MKNEKGKKNVPSKYEDVRAERPEFREFPDSAVEAILASEKLAADALARAETAESKAAKNGGPKKAYTRGESIIAVFTPGVPFTLDELSLAGNELYAAGGGKDNPKEKWYANYTAEALVAGGYAVIEIEGTGKDKIVRYRRLTETEIFSGKVESLTTEKAA